MLNNPRCLMRSDDSNVSPSKDSCVHGTESQTLTLGVGSKVEFICKG